MRLTRFKKRLLRWGAPLAIGGTAFQIGGCDPEVRSTLLAGLATTTQALTDTLIQVFFTSLEDAESGSAGSSGGLTTTP